jgi:diadenosine tetraphosphate (Ap4A) HIT family hydrolase
MSVETCDHVFGKIADGRIPEPKTFDAVAEYGVFTVIAKDEAEVGHSLVVPTECVPDTDLLSEQASHRVDVVSGATGIWLKAAFGVERVPTLVDGEEVPHAHVHRIPKHTPRRYLQVMGAEDPKPFVGLNTDQQAEIVARATLPPAYAEQLLAKLGGIDVPPSVFVEMAYDLAEPIPPSSDLMPLLHRPS